MRQRRWLVALGFLAVACPGQKPAPVAPVASQTSAPPAPPVVWRMSKSGIGFRLSDAEPPPAPRPKVAPSKPLSPADTARLIQRLPAFVLPAEEKAFALREKSAPPPRPGETQKTAFPPPVAPLGGPPAATQGAPATLQRWAPEGPVEVAPNLSLTFSEPMVELTAHADLAAKAPPVLLRPQPPGRFRWVGTQTLLFEPDGERFPKATDYVVEVPSGTRTIAGRALTEAKPFTFSLPTVKVEGFQPSDSEPQKLEPILFARFNQRVDPKALLGHVAVEAYSPKGAAVGTRLATSDEIEADEGARRGLAHAEEGRFIAFRAASPLPKATRFKATFQRGLPSAEGPKVTTEEQAFYFATYGLMKLGGVTCGWYGDCPPLAEWQVRFSNPIDEAKFDRSLVHVDPPLPGMKVNVSGTLIEIQGRSKGRTKYKVRIGAGLRDTFGQVLEADAEGTISVSRAKPMLFAEEHELSVLDPAFKPALSVYSVNHKALRVRLYQVGPEHYAKYEKYRQDYDYDGKLTQPPGRLIATETIRPDPKADELIETRIDLTRALTEGSGQVLVVVEPPTQKRPTNEWDHSREWVRTWVEVTKLGLQAFREPTLLHGWVTKLADGSPVAGAEVGVLKDGDPFPATPEKARSGPDGIASFPLGEAGSNVFARVGKDTVFLPGGGDSVFAAGPRTDRLLWFVMDDRNLYKPGERFNGKGWLRVATAGKTGDVGKLPGSGLSLDYRVSDPLGITIAKGVAPVDADGGFNLAFDLPKNANLGYAGVAFTLEGPSARGFGGRYTHGFQIQEFRRPEFEVTAETTEGPHYVGDHAIATLRATYYAGGSLPDSDVRWLVTASDADFSPPNHAGYRFGKPPERWWFQAPDKKRNAQETWEAKTTGGGEHRLRIDFDALDPSYPRKLDFEAGVSDVNRQSWTARTSLVVHPASVTVGLRVENGLPTAGQNLQIGALVTDIEGKVIPGRPVNVRCARIETTWHGDGIEETEKDPITCDVTSAGEDVRCACATKEGGLHRITAVVTDEHGRRSTTMMTLWVLGGDAPNDTGVTRGEVDVVPDKTEYRGGDEARLLVMAPFAPAEGVLTVEREGVVELKRFRLEKRVGTLSVRLDKSWVPGVHASVRLVGAAVRENEAGDPDPSLPRRPAYANGTVTLALPPGDRALDIAITTKPKELEPGGTTRIGVDVKDAAGHVTPGATVALVVVDESVLALAGYNKPDPLAVLYAPRNPDVNAYETHDLVLLGKPDLGDMALEAVEEQKPQEGSMEKKMDGFGSGHGRLGGAHKTAAPTVRRNALPAASAAPAPAPPRAGKKTAISVAEVTIEGEPEKAFSVRSNFDPLAAFVPRLVTDARGHAEASVKLPDNLTRYRVTAVAAANQNQFGVTESDVTARLPLMVRPSAPRFLNFGDRAELPVVLQNQTAEPMTVDTVLRVGNLRLFDPNGQRVMVPAADRVELRFPVAAARAGTARIQIGATGTTQAKRTHSDAAEIEFPVWTPATTEAFATYGAIDQGVVAQPVRMPSKVVKEFGELDITTSSTALQGLSDAVLYIVRYPFDCNEQIASRLLSIAALRDVLTAFSAEGLPKAEELEKTIALDIQKLADRQSWSGGWDYWRKDRPADPFVTVHVAHALVRAKAKGYKVPDNILSQALAYLGSIQHRFPSYWSPESRRWVEAYALDVRRRAGNPDPARARALLKEAGGVEKMPIEALGWLLPLFSKDKASATELSAVRRHLDNRIAETAGKAHFVSSFGDGDHLLLHSDRRSDGVVLDAFLEDRPESGVIPKVVAGLLADRKRGRWYNTQENVFILLALDHYFETFEKATPDFVARAWLGSGFAGEHAYRGRSNDRQQITIPLATIASMPQPSDVTLSKEGTGRLYFRIGMQYAPEDLRLPPAEHGFSVSRVYETTKDPADVTRDKDGTWRVRSGALVRVRVTMVAPARRYHVALVDPLPAGFEALNPALATTQSIPRDPDAGKSKSGGRTPWWWSSAWYEHQNLRDERVEAFTSLLWDGVYDYTYVARATTPGDFVVPPPKAEEMYDPETFGRGASDRVVVY